MSPPFYDLDPKNLQIIVNKGFCNIDLTAAYVNAMSHPPAADTDLCLSAIFCHSSALGHPETLITPNGQ